MFQSVFFALHKLIRKCCFVVSFTTLIFALCGCELTEKETFIPNEYALDLVNEDEYLVVYAIGSIVVVDTRGNNSYMDYAESIDISDVGNFKTGYFGAKYEPELTLRCYIIDTHQAEPDEIIFIEGAYGVSLEKGAFGENTQRVVHSIVNCDEDDTTNDTFMYTYNTKALTVMPVMTIP